MPTIAPITDHQVDAVKLIDSLVNRAVDRHASDIHLEPVSGGYEVRYRVDGLLETVDTLDAKTGGGAVGRLMVLGQLLTYRLDVPQEGRVPFQAISLDCAIDLRLAIIPTVHGLRAALRLPAELTQPQTLHALQLPTPVLRGLEEFARTDSGMLIVTGPAGSGKTTTIYALLQYIASVQPGVSIVTLEDPVERHVPGITQIEVKPFGEMTYERALRSILRQDPQVLMLGEIRDADTAKLAVQAALSGHRLICTLHAASPEGAIARLMEMEIEPYRITGCLWGVVSQRLLRRISSTSSPASPGEEVASGTHNRYDGRVPVAQWLRMNHELRAAVSRRADLPEIRRIWAQSPDAMTFWDSAMQLARDGVTDAAEINRVLGVHV